MEFLDFLKIKYFLQGLPRGHGKGSYLQSLFGFGTLLILWSVDNLTYKVIPHWLLLASRWLCRFQKWTYTIWKISQEVHILRRLREQYNFKVLYFSRIGSIGMRTTGNSDVCVQSKWNCCSCGYAFAFLIFILRCAREAVFCLTSRMWLVSLNGGYGAIRSPNTVQSSKLSF